MNRRHFLLRGGAAAVGGLGSLAMPRLLDAAEPTTPIRIRIVYALEAVKPTGPTWPNKGFDYGPVMERITGTLTRRCKGFEFSTALATSAAQAKQILQEDPTQPTDGYLVYQLSCLWGQDVVGTIAASGKPVLYADFQYGGSGGFLIQNAGLLRRKAPNIGFVASSDLKDLVAAVNCFATVKKDGSVASFVTATTQARLTHTPKATRLLCKPDDLKTLPIAEGVRRLKESRILAVRGAESGPAGEMLGIPVVHVPFTELNAAWKAAAPEEARTQAERWQRGAHTVTGVSRATLETSAAMYLGMKSLLKKHGANAITVNCLGGFYGGHIQAYPCLGFHELLNEGLVGACECDVRSTATMVALTTLTQGRPGYISDPVIDTAKRQIIYAHCVASNRVFGPQGSTNPFQILTHSEDRQGASVRSLLPLGYLTTSVQIEPSRKEFLLHRAKAVGNDPDDRACRTKLCAEPVGDLEKLFAQWDQWGWHRVTFYGDLQQPVRALADALGWKVVEEA